MENIAEILKNKRIEVKKDNRVTQEFQNYGLEIAAKLNDLKHKALYIKLAKTRSRSQIDAALRFVSDSKAKNPGALFMWKLKQLNK